MRNIRFINKSMFVLVVFSIFLLSACSVEPEPPDIETAVPEVSVPEVSLPTYEPETSIPEEKENSSIMDAPIINNEPTIKDEPVVEEPPTVEEEPIAFVEMERFSLDSTDLPPELALEYWDNIPMVLYSTANNVSFNGISIGSTREEMESIMDAQYKKFYSVHDPENANIGWYVLNTNLDIVIFDFDLEDGSYVNFDIDMSAPVLKICLSNLKYFD